MCACVFETMKMIKWQAYPSVALSDEVKAQWEKTPREPDSRSPCPPQRRPLPSCLQMITGDNVRPWQQIYASVFLKTVHIKGEMIEYKVTDPDCHQL